MIRALLMTRSCAARSSVLWLQRKARIDAAISFFMDPPYGCERQGVSSYLTGTCIMQPVKLILGLVAFVILTACSQEPQTQQTSEPIISPAPAAPEKAPDEAAALAAVAQINTAQKDYFSRNRRYALTYEELIDELFLKEEPTVRSTGYEIRLRPAADAA